MRASVIIYSDFTVGLYTFEISSDFKIVACSILSCKVYVALYSHCYC